jgi:hypothetical protein
MLINSTAELKNIIGGTPMNNTFQNIAPSIEDAKNFLIPFIGAEAYDIADEIANNNYSDKIDKDLQTKFLEAAQKPIAWKAQYDYVPEAQVLVDDTGIHIQKSNESQATAFQWQVEALQQQYLKKAYNTLNELLMFLDANREELPFWKESIAEQNRQRLFIQTPLEFGEWFDIKGNFALFLTIAPDMLLVQRSIIRNALGNELYQTILKKWQSKENFSDTEQAIFDACKPVVAYLALARRVKTLPAALMPDGIVEYFHSDRTNIKASNNIRLELLDNLYQQLTNDGNAALGDLNNLLNENNGTTTGASWVRSSRAIGF